MSEDSAEQFRHLGIRRLVYLKATTHDGERTIVIYGADGIPIEIVDGFETAVDTIARKGLSLVAIH